MSIVGLSNKYKDIQSYDYTISAAGVKSSTNVRNLNVLCAASVGNFSVKTSNYRLKASNGTLPENRLYRSHYKLIKEGRAKSIQYDPYNNFMYVDVPGPSYTAFYNKAEIVALWDPAASGSSYWTGLKNQAIQNLSQSFSKTRANLPVAAVEARQSIELVTQTAKRVATSLLLMRKGQFLKAATTLGMSKPPKRLSATINGIRQGIRVKGKQTTDLRGRSIKGDIKFTPSDVTSNWLAYRYGWVPLLSDIHGSLTTSYDNSRKVDKTVSTHYGYASDTKLKSVLSTAYTIPGTVNYPSVKANILCENRLSVKYKVKARLLSKAASGSAQLGLSNPLSVAWELVPFSFVADWFANVGDVLEGLSSFDGYEFVSGARMDNSEADFFTTSINFTRSGSWTIRSSTVNVKTSHIYYQAAYDRTAIISFPSVSFHVERNPFAGKMNRALDAISLVHQLFKR